MFDYVKISIKERVLASFRGRALQSRLSRVFFAAWALLIYS